MPKSWYLFMGGDDPLNVVNYFRIPMQQHMCLCGGSICAIYAEGIEQIPESPLSNNIQKYIIDALVSGQLQPEFPIASRKYIYLKDY